MKYAHLQLNNIQTIIAHGAVNIFRLFTLTFNLIYLTLTPIKTKIKAMRIPFSKLNNKELYALGLRTDEIITRRSIDEMGIKVYYDDFKDAFIKYEAGMQHENVSAGIVSQADGERDDAYQGFEGNLKNYIYFPDQEIKSKVVELLGKISKFGPRVIYRKYKEETTIILSIISMVENGYMDLINRTHTDVWFKLLKEKQDKFEKTLREHTKAQSENEIESATSVRPKLVISMRNLLTFMPLHHKVTQNNDLDEVIKQLTVELARF